jgi:DNA polymerase III epsilon subunit-like protein
LNPYKGEILSIGLVKLDGDELYVELECDAEPDPWVVENVLPLMSGPKVTRAEACRVVKEFVGDSRPFMVTDVGSFDAVYLYKLFGIDGHPFHWLPIDLASGVFSTGVDPEDLSSRFNIDTSNYRQHHALDDARVLRECYVRFFAG